MNFACIISQKISANILSPSGLDSFCYDEFEFFVLSILYLSRTYNLKSLSYQVKKYSILYYISSIPHHAGAFGLESWTMHRPTYLKLKLKFSFFSQKKIFIGKLGQQRLNFDCLVCEALIPISGTNNPKSLTYQVKTHRFYIIFLILPIVQDWQCSYVQQM